jgi:hypothetical protein
LKVSQVIQRKIIMKKFSFGLLGLLFFALPSVSRAETVAAYGVS